MSPAEALLYFTLEVSKAAKELGFKEKVEVVEMNFNDALTQFHFYEKKRTAAFVLSCVPHFECDPKVVILSDQLSTPKKRWLQCLARHEASHISLGHLYGTKSLAEDSAQHEMVRILMKGKWGQSSTCSEEWYGF